MNNPIKKLMKIVFSLLMITTIITININADTVTTDNLNECVSVFEIVNAETGKVIKPGDTVNTTDTYTVQMHFEEDPYGLQFDEKKMYYEFPEGMEVDSDDVTGREIKIDDKTVAVFSLIDHKKVMVEFVDDWPDVALDCKLNCDFDVKFKADDDITGKTIDLGDDNTITITIKKGAQLSVEKKAVDYDQKTHIVHYQVNVSSDGELKNAVITDVYDNKMSLVAGSVKVNGNPVSETESDPGIAGKKAFEASAGDFVSGEIKVITYDMLVNSEYLYKGSYTQTSLNNTAAIDGVSDGKTIHGEDEENYRVNHRNLVKRGNAVSLSEKPLIKWEITVGDGYAGGNVGGKLLEELGENQKLYVEDGVKPIVIEYVDKNGENKIIYADDLNNIVIPDGCRQAKVTYYTEYTNASAAGNTSYENLVSIVIGSNTWTSYASVDIKGVAPSIKKEHVSTGKDKDGKITYKISSTVPSGMDKTGLFYLKDTLTIDLSKVEKNVWNKPENISIKIDGAEYVDFSVIETAQDNVFEILFGGKDLHKSEDSKWPFSTETALEITYDISRSAKVDGETDNLNTMLGKDTILINDARLYYQVNTYAKDDDVYQETVEEYMQKKAVGINTVTKTIDYEVSFYLDMEGKNGAELFAHFIDDFDDRLEYVPESFYIERIREYETDPAKKTAVFKATEGNEKNWISTVDGNTMMNVPFLKLTHNGTKGATPLTKGIERTDLLVAHYTLKLKDDVILNPDSDVSNIYFDNTAYIVLEGSSERIVEDSVKVAYPNGLLTKYAKLKESKDDILTYTINFNPSRRNLVKDGDELILKDKMMSGNLALHPDTIKVYRINDDHSKTELLNTFKIFYGGTVIEFRIPDETNIEITYDAKIVSEDSDGVEVINKVELIGIAEINAEDSQVVPVRRAHTSAEGEHGKFTIFKTDADTGEPLEGAVFKLYTRKTDEVVLEDKITYKGISYYAAIDSITGKAAEFKTGSLGYVKAEHVVLTMDDEDSYLLVEKTAPEGYVPLSEPIEFVFNPHSDPGINYILNEGSIEIENVNGKGGGDEYGNLMLAKKVTGNDGDTSKMFSFKVEFSDGGTYNYDGSYTGSIKSGDIIKLKHNDSVTIHDLPEGTSYRVTEINADDYNVSCSNDTGTIIANYTVDVVFINSKSFIPKIPKTGID